MKRQTPSLVDNTMSKTVCGDISSDRRSLCSVAPVVAIGAIAGAAATKTVQADSLTLSHLGPVAIVVPDVGEELDDAIARARLESYRVYLPAGIYTTSRPIQLDDGTALLGDGPSTIIRPSADFEGNAIISAIGKDNIQVSGISIQGDPAGAYAHGFYLGGCANVDVIDCRIEEMNGRGLSIWASAGTSGPLLIRDCAVRSCTEDGIVFGNITDAEIIRCVVEGMGRHGIWLTGSPQRIRVLSNHIRNCAGKGLEVKWSKVESDPQPKDILISANQVSECNIGILCTFAVDVTIIDNVSNDNRHNGLDTSRCMRLRILGNSTERNGSVRDPGTNIEGHGILLWRTGDSVVAGNLSADNDQGFQSIRSGIRLNQRSDLVDDQPWTGGNVVFGNTVVSRQDPPSQHYGVYCDSADTPVNLILGQYASGHLEYDALSWTAEFQSFGHNLTTAKSRRSTREGEKLPPHMSSAPPQVPVVDELPVPASELRGKLVLLTENGGETLYVCMRVGNGFTWQLLG